MPRKIPQRIRIGIGGWNYKPWRGTFYPAGHPQKRELEYASHALTSIEINSTFHGPQKPASFENWYAATPPDFIFSVKGPMFATNRRVLAEAGDSIRRFLGGGVLQLKEKLGPINWQFGPNKKFDADDLDAFLALLPRSVEGHALRHAIEVRHESFVGAELQELARRHEVAIVLSGDSPYPLIEDNHPDFVYARILGTVDAEPRGYADRDLDRWAERAKAWAADGREVFLYVIGGYKERNPAAAMALIERVARPAAKSRSRAASRG